MQGIRSTAFVFALASAVSSVWARDEVPFAALRGCASLRVWVAFETAMSRVA